MARCKDCVHFGICKKGFPFADGKGGGWCEDFKSKSDCVPVVRCNDCKYWEQGKEYEPYCNHFGNMMTDTQAADFCSYGERRTDG